MAKQVRDVYGNALFELAIEENRIDEFMSETAAVLEALSDNPELYGMMMHPQIGEEEKVEVLAGIFKGRVSDELYSLLGMLLEKGHFADTGDVLETFADRVREYRKIGVVYVTTPMELALAQRKAVEERLLDITDFVSLEMNFSIDESLIGGMIIRIGDRVVDSSIKTKLDKLSHELAAGSR